VLVTTAAGPVEVRTSDVVVMLVTELMKVVNVVEVDVVVVVVVEVVVVAVELVDVTVTVGRGSPKKQLHTSLATDAAAPNNGPGVGFERFMIAVASGAVVVL
jgi:hypothetical protein